jgi:hypothetical protein
MPLANEIRAAINHCSRENVSNTPDFILAEYLLSCLAAFESASMRREEWYGHHLSIGGNARLDIKDGQAHPPTSQGMPLSCAVVGCSVEGPHSHNEDCTCKQA